MFEYTCGNSGMSLSNERLINRQDSWPDTSKNYTEGAGDL